MPTLGKGTLYLKSVGKTYKFIPNNYSITDLVSASDVPDVIADSRVYSSFIASIEYLQVTHYLRYSNRSEAPTRYNLLNNPIDFETSEEISVTLGFSEDLFMDRTDSADNQVIGDLLFKILQAFENIGDPPDIVMNTVDDSYNNPIDLFIYRQPYRYVVTSSTVTFKGNTKNVEYVEKYTRENVYVFPIFADTYRCLVTTDVLKTNYQFLVGNDGQILDAKNVPEKPVWLGPYTDEYGKYWLITTTSRRKGNIYFNGGATPLQSWTDDAVGPWSYKFYPQQVGVYTANTISTIDIPVQRDIYSELSEIIIVENEVVDIQISFNEYTGTITATAPTGSYFGYKLMSKHNNEYVQVDMNSTGIFQIMESGTYRVECIQRPLFQVNPSEDITVEATLDAPDAYVEFSNPSQLGFDEVENANVYDIYRVSDDGEDDELVESVTVGVSAKVRSVKRAEKIFRVVIKDDRYSL